MRYSCYINMYKTFLQKKIKITIHNVFHKKKYFNLIVKLFKLII